MLGSIIKMEREKQKMSQEALAEGICAVSYLSKIENQKITASEEIYTLLFDALDLSYVSDEDQLLQFKKDVDDFFEAEFRLEHGDYSLFEQAQTMINSKYHLQALCIRVFLGDYNAVEALENLEDNIEISQQLQYHFSLGTYYSYHANNKKKSLDHFLKCLYLDKTGTIHNNIGYLYFLMGNFESALNHATLSYDLFAKNGYVVGMLQSANLKMLIHSNSNQIKSMEKENRICKEINSYVQDESLEYMIEYNLGATYLMNQKYQKARDHLYNASRLMLPNDIYQSQMINQKLLFLYLIEDEKEKAEEIYHKISKEGDETFLKSLEAAEFMLSHDNYYKELEYHSLLLNCIESSKIHHHYGYELFYAELLFDAYEKSNKYKQALRIRELYPR